MLRRAGNPWSHNSCKTFSISGKLFSPDQWKKSGLQRKQYWFFEPLLTSTLTHPWWDAAQGKTSPLSRSQQRALTWLGPGESPRQGCCWESLMRDLGAPHKCPPSLPRQAQALCFVLGTLTKSWMDNYTPALTPSDRRWQSLCVCVCACVWLCCVMRARRWLSPLCWESQNSQLYHTLIRSSVLQSSGSTPRSPFWLWNLEGLSFHICQTDGVRTNHTVKLKSPGKSSNKKGQSGGVAVRMMHLQFLERCSVNITYNITVCALLFADLTLDRQHRCPRSYSWYST